MQSGVTNLPLDVWAQVARFVPPAERTATFWALRKALLLPTHGTLHETQFRFLEIAAREEEQAHALAHPGSDPLLPTWPIEVEQMLVSDMGFAREDAIRALCLCGGDRYHAVLLLLSEVDWMAA